MKSIRQTKSAPVSTRKSSCILTGPVAVLLATALAADSAFAASISITFGSGTQNGNGSGPGEVSNFWNNVNATPWDGGGHPYGTNGNGHGPFSSDTPTAIGIVDGTNTTLSTAVTIQSYDAGQAAAIDNNGAYGGWGQTGTGASIGLGTNAYDQQFALFQTSENTQPSNLNCTITFANIPYASYNVYVGGKNLYQGAIYGSGTQINGAASFLGLSGSTFQVVAQWGHPYDGLGGKISYIQFVEAVFATAYWTGTTGNLWSVPNNFATDQSGTPSLTGALDASTDVIFNAAGAANFGNTQLGGNQTIHTLTFGSNATTAVGIGGGDTLTITPTLPTTGITVQTASGSHTISSNVALGANQSWTVTDVGQTLLVSGDISGTSKTLAKAGAGTLTLSGTNTHSGSTVVNGGVLVVASDTALGATGGSGATLKFTGGTLRTTAAITSDRPVEVAAGGGTVDTNGFIATLSGALSGTGSLTKDGAGTLNLTGTSSNTASMNVNGGTLRGNTDSLKRNVVLANTSELAFNQTADGTYSKVVSGVGKLTKEGAGVLILAGSHTYNGETKITEGTLRLAPGSSYPVSGLLGKWTFDDGNANDLSGNSYHGAALGTPSYSSADTHGNTGQALVLDGSSGIKVDTGGSQTVFNGGTSMTVSAWVKGWPGDWSPFVSKNGEGDGWQMRRHGDTSNLDWTARGLDSNGGSDFQGTSTSVANGQWHMVTMTYDGAQRKIYVDGALDATRDNNETIATGSNALLTFGARNYGNPNSFDAHFTGKLDDIYFYNRALTALEIMNAYNDVGGGGDLLPIGTTVTMSAGTTLDLNDINQQVGALKDEGGAGSRPVLLAGATLKIGNATKAETTFSGAISGAGTVEKNGTSIQTLNGAQQYDTLTVSQGTLNVNGAVGITPANGTASVVVTDGAKLKFGSVSQTLSSLTIGAGATVTFTSGAASGAFGGGGKGASLSSTAAVPEPGTIGLLLGSALGILHRRRRA